jgi:hypothetical protein
MQVSASDFVHGPRHFAIEVPWLTVAKTACIGPIVLIETSSRSALS